jgi:putative hydrolase of the HAD superfamily
VSDSVAGGAAAAPPPAPLPASLPTPLAVLFDVDYTLIEPGDMFHADGYRRCGEQFGLDLDVGRWEEAERAAYEAVKARRERSGTRHDNGVYDAIAEAVITAMGGGDPEAVHACAEAVIAGWTDCRNFTLYDDAIPCLKRLRAAGLKIALVSNTNRSLLEVIGFFALEPYVDAAIASVEVGYFKPAPQIYQTALAALHVGAGEAVMVGDNPRDDVTGALAVGLAGAVLIDRKGVWDYPVPTIRSLVELPALLGL